MDPLYATIEQFAAKGFTHVECYCPRCRPMHLAPPTAEASSFGRLTTLFRLKLVPVYAVAMSAVGH
jgi:hypothetical protein